MGSVIISELSGREHTPLLTGPRGKYTRPLLASMIATDSQAVPQPHTTTVKRPAKLGPFAAPAVRRVRKRRALVGVLELLFQCHDRSLMLSVWPWVVASRLRRSLARPRRANVLTVPTGIPSTRAISASLRSS